MTQCAVEERRNLELAINGLVTYAETLSVYGTEQVFVDGDDTPWSKSFLGAAYASRGVKVRFTSGTGSEALMGQAQGMSMLYLEARCISVVRAAGSQGVQNGSISCVALVLSLPGGTRAILAENVIAAWLDLEVASGNDAIASHSAIRKTAKLMGQFLPGTDFVTSGYSVMPRHDNTFGGGNYDADDLDEWLTIQRDWQVDGGIEPVAEDEVTRVRARAARAVQAVFEELGLPPVTDAEVEAATTGYDASDMPDRDRAADVEAADAALARKVSGLDVALALDRRGFDDVARAVVDMQRQRVSADYLQTSAVIDADGLVHSAVNDPNLYAGPGTGYRLEGERWEVLQALPHVIGRCPARNRRRPTRTRSWRSSGEAGRGTDPAEVVIAVGPAFADAIRETINGLDHGDVLAAIVEGATEAGASPRIVRVRRVADVAFIAHDGARLSGSGVALGIQSKGTAVIHRADLQPLDNLELFGMSPLYSLESYRAMGRNAAGYALGSRVGPVPTELDNFARAKLIVRTTLLHARETRAVVRGAGPARPRARRAARCGAIGTRANRSTCAALEKPLGAVLGLERALGLVLLAEENDQEPGDHREEDERLLGGHQDSAEVLILGRVDPPQPHGAGSRSTRRAVARTSARGRGTRTPRRRRRCTRSGRASAPHGARRSGRATRTGARSRS